MIALKLAAAPLVVWLASQAGRRFGHRVAGLIGGFPLIAGPIMLFLALDAPRDLMSRCVPVLQHAAQPKRRRIWSIASLRRCRCGNGGSKYHNGCEPTFSATPPC